jgi:predicted TIM-barrel fold metal-dependent hydrolase
VAQMPSIRAVFIRPVFVENRYLNHPYYDPLWADLERRSMTAAVHASAGLWNPEWTSHGPFIEKIKDRLVQPIAPGGGGGPFAGGSGGAGQTTTFTAATPLGHPVAPILANWLDNHMFVASTLIGFTVMERYPAMKVVVAHGKASWMQEVLEKMEASTRVIPLLHHYPVSTEPEEMWENGNVMLGFDAEERLILKLPQEFAHKVMWGSRYPHHDTTSAWDAIAKLRDANVPDELITIMIGGNAARQFAVEPFRRSAA